MTRSDRRAAWIAGLAVALATAGCSSRAGNPLRVATGYVSHVMCSEVFVTGREPAAAYAQSVAANPSFRGVGWALRHDVDRERQQVTVRMLNEPDMAGFAERAALDAAPGAEWRYTDGNTAIVGRIVRDAVGGRAADVLRFARKELFEPLGMRHVTMELDATGTPIAAAFMFAPAREWARFGLLALGDGVVGGARILPEGWMRYSTSPTPGAPVGYGAGWWTNEGESAGARFRTGLGMPRDARLAVGANGQFVVALPAERLVIARFGTTYDARMAMRDIIRLTADTIAALRGEAAASAVAAADD